MDSFQPDYHHILNAAKNIKPNRLPLYEHVVDLGLMEKILDRPFAFSLAGTYEDKKEFFRHFCDFHLKMGYDTIQYEEPFSIVIQGSMGLLGYLPGIIKTRDDFDNYRWDEMVDGFFEKTGDRYRALCEVMPEGMKIVGGVGTGIFEAVQDFTTYTDLCYMQFDDPGLYKDLYAKVGDTLISAWKRFMDQFAEHIAVCRTGDDLGFKSATLISPKEIKEHIVPFYKKLADLSHAYDKPFLLHSCGCIFDVMDDLIDTAGIDAKHSNEDEIAPFSTWVEKYGDKIGNFGGIDVDYLCRHSKDRIEQKIIDIIEACIDQKGFAFGTGNSIPDYIPVDNYRTMIETVREYRGDYL